MHFYRVINSGVLPLQLYSDLGLFVDYLARKAPARQYRICSFHKSRGLVAVPVWHFSAVHHRQSLVAPVVQRAMVHDVSVRRASAAVAARDKSGAAVSSERTVEIKTVRDKKEGICGLE
jgi:hypothetical protein